MRVKIKEIEKKERKKDKKRSMKLRAGSLKR